MANRVLLTAGALKVSKPGFNVMTAADADLIFSSDFSQGSLFSRGSLTFSSNTVKTVNYGKTFVNMPMIMFNVNRGTPMVYNEIYINDFILSASPTAASAWLRVGSSSFSYHGPLVDGMAAKYIIWDLDL
ncbi:hypothetical protein BPNPMPFG_002522 [Mesorhizobium sp. AR07]|uniref:hypothetical protein n=1 Tax=Mesorhizobium sp. AR07 TaxID=2865838 RepID=UPI00215DDB65|nr:hypothetical protein [Mesorhizobium sp. AR07]UVK46812.1 hypothetical protein BPNPMPFG_002522 [Mesorhizobium sp. AR07]